MAEVTESSLNLAAHEIVAAFNNENVTLNDGVVKKASELGLNRDQTARLIERTNSEAFLSLFPGKTDFAVADPNVILKTASVNVEPVAKVASTEKVASYKSSYAESLERDAYQIFGVDRAYEKVASDSKEICVDCDMNYHGGWIYIQQDPKVRAQMTKDYGFLDHKVFATDGGGDPIGIRKDGKVTTYAHGTKTPKHEVLASSYDDFMRNYIPRVSAKLKTAKELFSERVDAAVTLDNIGVEKAAKLIDMENASNTLWSVFKEEALSGRSTADMEREVVLSFPEKTAAVCAVFETMMDKLASATLLPVDSFDRLQVEDINVNEVVMPSRLTNAFKGVLDYDKY